MRKFLQKYYIFIIFFIALLVRTINISANPVGLNQDEASIGYEAYLIMKSGFDRNNNFLPVHLEAWGSGQNALYAYLSIPFIFIFGLNVFSIRLLNALLGSCSVVLIFYIGKWVKNKRFGVILSLLMLINPWSIMASRWSLESNLFPFIFILGVFFIAKAIKSKKMYFHIIGYSILAISLYAYGTAYLVVPVFILLTVPYLLINKFIKWRYLIFSGLTFILLAWPIAMFVIINKFDLPQINWLITIPKLPAMRTDSIFSLFKADGYKDIPNNIQKMLNILIFQNDGNEYNATKEYGTIYLFANFLVVVSIFAFFFDMIKYRKFNIFKHPHFLFIAWLISALLVGVLCDVNINRINIIFIPLVYLCGGAIELILEGTEKKKHSYINAFFTTLYSISFISFLNYYSTTFSKNLSRGFFEGLGEAIVHVEQLTDKNDQIFISNNGINMPYIHIAFFAKISYQEFKETVVYSSSKQSQFRTVSAIANYRIGTYYPIKGNYYIFSLADYKEAYATNFTVTKFTNFYVVY